ncbi:MAG TPA: hypothetical protein DEQ60_00880 [Methylophaga sp.]|nr:hypothetical protein [Methylophaga sp.]
MKLLTTENEIKNRAITFNLLAALIIFLVVFSTYSAVLFNTFGVLDDWTFLYNAITGQEGTVPLLIGAGRPLNAFFSHFGFMVAGSIEGLATLRFVGVVGISILGFCLYLFAHAQRVDFFTSLLISIGVVLLPSFQVYASWAQHFTTPYAGILALCSAFILSPECRIRERSRRIAIFYSASLLLVSLLIYQPLAMLFWTGILISSTSSFDSKNKWTIEGGFDVLVAFSLAMVGAFIAFKVGQSVYPGDSSRYGFVSDVYGKLIWFLSEPLANSASLHIAPRNCWIQWFFIVLVLVALLLLGKQRGLTVATSLCLIVSLALVLSYVPNLVTAENWASYRSIGALGATFFVSVIMTLRLPIKWFLEGRNLRKSPGSLYLIPTFLVAAFAGVLTLLAQTGVNKGFVLPNVIELNNLASVIKEQNFTAIDDDPFLIVKTSSWRDASAKVSLYDEFGMHSSLRDYYALIMVKTVLRSMGVASDSKVSLYSDNERGSETHINRKKFIIDFPKLVTNERFKTNLIEWGSVNQGIIYPANINDKNWTAGVWTNAELPDFYSFTYKKRFGDKVLEVGDELTFNQSGVRVIQKLDKVDGYVNVLVGGKPLSSDDGYPHPVWLYE